MRKGRNPLKMCYTLHWGCGCVDIRVEHFQISFIFHIKTLSLRIQLFLGVYLAIDFFGYSKIVPVFDGIIRTMD
jgi:hypothetical protein